MPKRPLLALATLLASAAALPPPAPEPILASPEQDEAEATLADLLRHPDVKAIQAGLRKELAATAIGQTRDGAATIDRAPGGRCGWDCATAPGASAVAGC